MSGARAVAHGLTALRKRYIRRAQFLAMDQGFRQACAEERRAWNRVHTRYVLPTHMDECGFPAALVRDYLYDLTRFEHAEACRDDLPGELDSISDHYCYEYEKDERRASVPSLYAYDEWRSALWRVVHVFFPEKDFPVLSDSAGHPASMFVGWAIGSLPVGASEQRAEALIAVSLKVSEALSDQHDPSLVMELFPGITARDIRDVASSIAEQANRQYAPQLPLARIRAMRWEGLTHAAIADRLGMTARAVMDAAAFIDQPEI